MNIFVLDKNPIIAAQYHCDAHVVKMILETAQLLSTAHHMLDGENAIQGLYKKTHYNHPCAKWVRQSNNNYTWALCLLESLCREYTFRYKNKIHKTEREKLSLLQNLPKNIPIGYLTPFVQAMPDQYKNNDCVSAYRSYYIAEKAYFAKWNNNREAPEWWSI